MVAAVALPRVFPHLDVRREVTVGHRLLDCDAPTGVLAKVNPPIRPREDGEALRQALRARQVDWVVSNQACCAREMKVAAEHPHEGVVARPAGPGGLAGPLIHSYPQVFPHPQPAHILWISLAGTASSRGSPSKAEAEKVHVDWGLRFD